MKANWDSVVRAIRVQARVAYARQLSLAKRLQYVQLYLLSKIWYIAQTLPADNQPYPTAHLRMLLVYLAGHPIQSARYHPAAPEGTGWVGPAGHRCQMQDTTSQPYLEIG